MVSLSRWTLLPLIVAVVWHVLDASPTLFLYDAFATLTGGWQLSSLEGKTVWVTGASSGIGASLVCELMSQKVGHVILSSRNRDQLEQVAHRCGNHANDSTTKVSILPYDATQENGTVATVDRALALTSDDHPIDILILNAGVYQNRPAMRTPKEERDRITRINYQAPVDLADALLHHWKRREPRARGHLVVVASVMAHGPHGLSSTYAASKAALRGYFGSLSTEEASWLRVDVVCPGSTDTDMWRGTGSRPTKGGAMTSDRVAHLILTGVAGPRILFFETWISKSAGLLWLWLRHYLPGLFHVFVHVLAFVRVPIWEHENLDAMDVALLLSKLVLILLGRYPP